MVNKKVNNRQIYYSSLNDELQQVPLLHAGTLISLLPATVKFLIQSVLGNFIHILWTIQLLATVLNNSLT